MRHSLSQASAAFLVSIFSLSPAFAQTAAFLDKFGTQGAANGQFDGPQGLAVNANNGSLLFVSEFGNNRIQRLSSTGAYQTQFGAFGVGDGQTANPKALASRHSTNQLYVVDQNNSRIQRLAGDGTFQLKWGTGGLGNGQFQAPTDVAVNQSTGNVYVTELFNPRVQRFDANGAYLGQWGTAGTGPGQFQTSTYSVAVNSSTGQVYVSDSNRIQRFSATGVFELQWGTSGTGPGQFDYPNDIVVDPAGRVYVVDRQNHRVQRFSAAGVHQLTVGSQGSGDGHFQFPNSIGISNDGILYVSDYGNHRVQRFLITESPTVLQTAIDLGTISNVSDVYEIADKTAIATFAHAGQVLWYKFTIAGSADDSTGFYLDIATEPTGAPGTFAGDDTEIALYRGDGTLVSNDDDRGVSLYSQLSFSQAAPALPDRGPLLAPGFSNANPASGQDGPLPAGTYYLAIAGYNAAFNSTNFEARTTASATGTVRLSLRTDMPFVSPPPAPVANRPPSVAVAKRSLSPTARKKIVISGTVADDNGGTPRVFVKVGRAKFRPAKTSGFKWKFTASLSPGRNVVAIYAEDNGGLKSPVRKIRITRK